MNIIYINPKKLKPYKKNAKEHGREQIEAVKSSIKQFGIVQPVVIDKNSVIVIGHCRTIAAAELGIDTIPCVIVDELSQEQINALRLADNKTNESEWIDDLLNESLEEITDIDMSTFGFEYPEDEPEEDEPEENERQRTNSAYNLDYIDKNITSGFYEMPIIQRCDYIPKELIGFNYALSSHEYSKGIHFYIDDYQFERIWNDPDQYIDMLSEYDCVLSPDFSLYIDMPMSMKIWNVFRSRLIGQVLQNSGCTVIPTLSWAEKETFTFCFDGIEPGGTVSVSTIGVKRSKESMKIWTDGMEEAINRIHPKNILLYGGNIGFDFGKINVKEYKNQVTERIRSKKEEMQI